MDWSHSGVICCCLLCLLLGRVPDITRAQSPPKFQQSIYSVSVPEDLPVGALALQVKATANDTKSNQITYRFRSGKKYTTFVINATTGSITVSSPLDRETSSFYTINVEALDTEVPPQTATATVTIIIRDLNDNAPRFPTIDYRATIFDDNPTWNQIVVRVTARDADDPATSNARLRYFIVAGNANDTFEVRPSGDVVATKPIDFDRRRRYELEIVARDEGNPPLYSINNASVTIDVLTSRYLTPIFSGVPYVFNVSENISVPHDLARISAKYFNWITNGKLSYRIVSGNEDGHFHLNASGSLSVVRRLDREIRSFHDFVVEARDDRNASYYQKAPIRIIVTDVNDNRPRVRPAQLRPVTISQNFPIGRALFNVTCVDDDVTGNPPAPRLTELNSSGLFQINPMNQIVLKRQIDTPHNATYALLIRCEDDGNLFDEVRFEVRVVLQNDHAPRFIGNPYTFDVMERTPVGRSVFTVTAHDDDRGPDGIVSFALVDSTTTFRIDALDGTVYTQRELDRERKDIYTLVAIATDQGKQPKSASAFITVRISDVNDNSPHCARSSFDVLVSEHMTPNNVAVNLNCSDADGNALVYQIVRASNFGVFDVDSSGNIILKSVNLAQRDNDTYTLDIRVSDSAGPSPSRPFNVTVVLHVQRVNDFPPIFSGSGVFTKEIKENVAVETAIMQITATDADRGLDGNVAYKIVGGSGMSKFRIDSRGRIFLVKPLDSEAGDTELTLNIRATDGGGGGDDSKSATATVKLAITNVNDNSPVITVSANVVQLYTSDPIGTLVANISCDDADLQSIVTYEFRGEEAILRYLAMSGDGRVYVATSLSGVTEKLVGNVLFICHDDGVPSKKTNTTVRVEILPGVASTASTAGKIISSHKISSTEEMISTVAPKSGIMLIAIVISVVAGIIVVLLLIGLVLLCRRKYGRSYNVEDARVDTCVNNTAAIMVELKSKKIEDDSAIELDIVGKEKKQAQPESTKGGLRSASSMPVVQVLQAKQESYLLKILEDPNAHRPTNEERLRRSISSCTSPFVRAPHSPARKAPVPRPPSMPVHPDRLRSLQSDRSVTGSLAGSVVSAPATGAGAPGQAPDNRRRSIVSLRHMEQAESCLSLPSVGGTESHV